ncbi:HrpB1 family type III secretion system apparatus protein [Paraburkholderia sp. ZP32-5]|uniref:HrpB1 family type III secretion system apparatus protein n=1 Tax=Paraburkholderia sp. ZP32-5 TaxID=2883245 RepID=UPI001F240CB0|nr:HrpB1 family type III secretion system apparatus protein [Paraburkholderia sp. ZP32-5]
MQANEADNVEQLGQTIVDCIRQDRLDDAETLWERLCNVHPEAGKLLIFPVSIAIRRGRVQDAWQIVNGLHDDDSPGLKALCLHALGDPLWHGYAVADQDHPDPRIRKAMRGLLGLDAEAGAF